MVKGKTYQSSIVVEGVNGKTISLPLVIACDTSGHLGAAGRTWRFTAACRAEARHRTGVVSTPLPRSCRKTTLTSAFFRNLDGSTAKPVYSSIMSSSNMGADENCRNPGAYEDYIRGRNLRCTKVGGKNSASSSSTQRWDIRTADERIGVRLAVGSSVPQKLGENHRGRGD
ncbi:hypothetical protein BO78DRAFT_393869 [Aspergillus sclerotiicarbonarius CBS 121057]|uniref:Uncharacterized protein n=1 Tax=Aspergillus sclerotiicarbonarius (strain CBS 121057 / IBT 28362) TaxID=1448318 RepID=A0A319FMQ2_ASPSB|nr:hypothetical protein BO78DRAFT_393869 [Aspergillus sclerotiicarbonarius CBS 121057]